MASFGGSEGDGYVDITAEVRAAASVFGVDELLASPSFSLFESMSACELMDPKMDALGNEAPQPSIEERLERGEIPQDIPASLRVFALSLRLLRCRSRAS